MSHDPASCDLLHDPLDDVSDAITPSVGQAEAIDLLELNPHRHHLVRLSRSELRHVDAVTAALATARAATTTIPTPRLPADAPVQEPTP